MTRPPAHARAGPDPGRAVADGIRCMLMRGGTSKGLYFLAADLPERPQQRDPLLLRIMGSGHPLQVDGLGGRHSLTSKAAIVSPSAAGDADTCWWTSTWTPRPGPPLVRGAGVVRTARKLFDGTAYPADHDQPAAEG